MNWLWFHVFQIVNSISPSELGSYLSQPNVVDSDAEICFIFKNMRKTPEFLENVSSAFPSVKAVAHNQNFYLVIYFFFSQVEVPDPVKRSILPCVWPLALSSDNQTEIDLWFDRRLKVYLKFLNTGVIGSNDTLNAPCLSYRKMWVFSSCKHNNSYKFGNEITFFLLLGSMSWAANLLMLLSFPVRIYTTQPLRRISKQVNFAFFSLWIKGLYDFKVVQNART